MLNSHIQFQLQLSDLSLLQARLSYVGWQALLYHGTCSPDMPGRGIRAWGPLVTLPNDAARPLRRLARGVALLSTLLDSVGTGPTEPSGCCRPCCALASACLNCWPSLANSESVGPFRPFMAALAVQTT